MRLLSTTFVGMIWLSALAAAQQAEPSQYGGRTLDEWRQVMKTLEPASPAAADAVPGLLALVRTGDVPQKTRAQAAYTLGRIGKPAVDAVPVLADLLHAELEPDQEFPAEASGYWAAKALGLFGSEAAIATPELIAVATDRGQSLMVRLAAVETLGSIGGAHPDAIPALMQWAEGVSADTQAAHHAQQLRGAAIDSLGAIGPAAGAAVPLLIRLTRDQTGNLRKRAANALGSMGTTAGIATEALVDLMLFDDLPEVREAAALALAQIGESGHAALVQLVTDEEVSVRRQAATALASVEKLTEAGREALRAALEDEDVHVRLSAVVALRRLAEDRGRVVPVVISALTEPDRQPRIRAYRLVVEMRPQLAEILPQLQELADDDRPFVRQVARKAIAELTQPAPP